MNKRLSVHPVLAEWVKLFRIGHSTSSSGKAWTQWHNGCAAWHIHSFYLFFLVIVVHRLNACLGLSLAGFDSGSARAPAGGPKMFISKDVISVVILSHMNVCLLNRQRIKWKVTKLIGTCFEKYKLLFSLFIISTNFLLVHVESLKIDRDRTG